MECLLRELSDVLDHNDIDEIGITLDATLPPIFRVDTKLGLAKSILKPLFTYALETMYTLRAMHDKPLDQTSALCSNMLVNVTRTVLIIKGDHPIAYDLRKTLIKDGYYTIQKELAFTALLFTRHPKCPSGWQHRRWCLSLKSRVRHDPVRLLAAEVETERELCRAMAEAHPKNYYAWVHRLWLIQYFSKFQIEDELHFTKVWLQSHVSDHSAVNHRIQVISTIVTDPELLFHITQCPCTADESADTCVYSLQLQFLGTMLSESAEVIVARPGHESLWCLRRSLLEILFENMEQRCSALSGCVFHQLFDNLRVPYAYLANWRVRVGASDDNSQVKDAFPKNTGSLEWLNNNLRHDCHVSPASPGCTLHTWLPAFLSSEMQLVRHSVHDETAWDYAAQRLMALRYGAFLLDRTTHYCVDSAARLTNPPITHTLRESAEQTTGMEQSVNSGPELACQMGSAATLTLREALYCSLRDVCEQLNAEDKYGRLWLYKRAAST